MKRIPLPHGQSCVVDDADYALVSAHRWHTCHGYVARNVMFKVGGRKQRRVFLHRELLRPKKGLVVDHINHDLLDNRRSNLRVCTNSENIQNQVRRRDNTSGYRGVVWSKAARKWEARITANKKFFRLGYFASKEDAAAAFRKAATTLFGDFANLTN